MISGRTSERIVDRIDKLREARAFQNYLEVRERVLAMKDIESELLAAEPSAYWREELENFDYMLDASPLVIEKLRQHTFHVTGVRVYEYRTHKDANHGRYAEKLAALMELGGPELLVPESPILGGFGFDIDGALYNLDTLKFYESMIALDRGAVLGDFRESSERKVALEIGGGWGGLAYVFKTLFPNTTYLIIDFPELFLFSATYLMTAFPDAKVRFYDGSADAFQELDGADFVFVPNTALGAVRPDRLDLTLNTVSFQEMTTEQVREYVHHVYELGCPFLYSLNRDRSLYNPELSGVRELVAERYWLHEVPVLPVSYGKMLDEIPSYIRRKAARARDQAQKLKAFSLVEQKKDDYRHVIGWRRMVHD